MDFKVSLTPSSLIKAMKIGKIITSTTSTSTRRRRRRTTATTTTTTILTLMCSIKSGFHHLELFGHLRWIPFLNDSLQGFWSCDVAFAAEEVGVWRDEVLDMEQANRCLQGIFNPEDHTVSDAFPKMYLSWSADHFGSKIQHGRNIMLLK